MSSSCPVRRPQRGESTTPGASKPERLEPGTSPGEGPHPPGRSIHEAPPVVVTGGSRLPPSSSSTSRSPPDRCSSLGGPGHPAWAPTAGALRPGLRAPSGRARPMVSGSGFRAVRRSPRGSGQLPKRARRRSPQGQPGAGLLLGTWSGAPSVRSPPQGAPLRRAGEQAKRTLFVRVIFLSASPTREQSSASRTGPRRHVGCHGWDSPTSPQGLRSYCECRILISTSRSIYGDKCSCRNMSKKAITTGR
ncbi:hypothetical protein NDU88_005574 [Pleurodeles waltl]|uniref:Uncharacterized protein n=1 Tax=Pleurodeles waltl TaxID=8319 RepID=A0AAV7RKK2_PLEWA|nr:hypothetical protein NDU88_005574 [Pleurodeles waltl]